LPIRNAYADVDNAVVANSKLCDQLRAQIHLAAALNLNSCAPCQGAVFQRVRIPPGNFRSGR
jgi:hypothetical protein